MYYAVVSCIVWCCANSISTISFGIAAVYRKRYTQRQNEHLVSYGARANRNGFCPYAVKCVPNCKTNPIRI